MAEVMHRTQSLSWPNMFDVARNRVAVKEGNSSIVNRSKLLILTEPTELYNEPAFGVGLKKYLWQYNTKNVRAIIQDKIKSQLKQHEPCVNADDTSFADSLLFTGSGESVPIVNEANQLKMTVGLQTIYEDTLQVVINLEEERIKMFGVQEG